ncbi:MAG: hypothetical protein QXQ57_04220 [Sulfolobales archaeon]
MISFSKELSRDPILASISLLRSSISFLVATSLRTALIIASLASESVRIAAASLLLTEGSLSTAEIKSSIELR